MKIKAQATYSFANIHVAAIFNDDFTLLSRWPICHRFNVFMHYKFLANPWPHWFVESSNYQQNDEEEEQRECQANAKNYIRKIHSNRTL